MFHLIVGLVKCDGFYPVSDPPASEPEDYALPFFLFYLFWEKSDETLVAFLPLKEMEIHLCGWG